MKHEHEIPLPSWCPPVALSPIGGWLDPVKWLASWHNLRALRSATPTPAIKATPERGG